MYDKFSFVCMWRMSADIGIVRSWPDIVKEGFPASKSDTVTTNISRCVPTTESISLATRGGPSVTRTVTSSSTRMSSTVSYPSVKENPPSAKPSLGKRPISFASRYDRIYRHTSGMSREELPRLLDTNFRIPLLSRVNERKVKKRHRESGDHHSPKYPRTDLFGYTRRPLGEHNFVFVRGYRARDETRLSTNISLDVIFDSRRGRRLWTVGGSCDTVHRATRIFLRKF